MHNLDASPRRYKGRRGNKLNYALRITHYAFLIRRPAAYPLMPLLDTPDMMYLRRNTNTRNRGAETRATAAIWTG